MTIRRYSLSEAASIFDIPKTTLSSGVVMGRVPSIVRHVGHRNVPMHFVTKADVLKFKEEVEESIRNRGLPQFRLYQNTGKKVVPKPDDLAAMYARQQIELRREAKEAGLTVDELLGIDA
jgi:hypothetical protein